MSTVLAFIPSPSRTGVHVGPLFFHFYGLAIAIGVLCAFWLARKRWQDLGRNPADIEVAGIWAVIAGFVGGRLGYVSTHTGSFAGRWVHVLFIWEGGLALYGGLTLGILTGVWVAWRRGLPVWLALDAAIPAIPLAQAFGRWGNYFNQELFGTPTRLPWALEISRDHRPARYVGFSTFHPTFLYESLWDLLIVGVLLWLSAGRGGRRLRTGSLVLCYLGLYAFGRLLLELIRTDTTFRLLGLSRNGWVSLGVVVGAGVWLVLRERHHPATQEPDAGGAEGADVSGGPGGTGGHQGLDGDLEPATVSAGRVDTGAAAGAEPADAPGPDAGGGDDPPAATGPTTPTPATEDPGDAGDAGEAGEAGALKSQTEPGPSRPSEEPTRDGSSPDGKAS
jgi:prolipoprotein diacylglyceryl transferase